MKAFAVNVSITDFPLFMSLEELVRNIKRIHADGIEVVAGVKTRWNAKELRFLSEKYELPIASVHQPPWSGLGLWRDEGFVLWAKSLGTDKIVFHPLHTADLSSNAMKEYFQWLTNLEKKYGITVMFENMPQKINLPIINFLFPVKKGVADVQQVAQMLRVHGLAMTFDTTHTEIPRPHTMPWMETIFPLIRNIHLSSFTKEKEHLPLTMGEFDTRGFITYLAHKQYTGLITLEIRYPKALSLSTIDFPALEASIMLVKNSSKDVFMKTGDK